MLMALSRWPNDNLGSQPDGNLKGNIYEYYQSNAAHRSSWYWRVDVFETASFGHLS